MLSGGEKGRLALAKILKRRPNLLILDEPTNHMDIVGKETLVAMLKDFNGSVLFVSHDRYFVSQIADSLLIFEEDSTDPGASDSRNNTFFQVQYYPYSYEQYQQDKTGQPDEAQLLKGIPDAKNKGSQTGTPTGSSDRTSESTAASVPASDRTVSGSGYNPGKELSRLTRRLAKVEELISQCEAELQSARDELLNPDYASDYGKLSEIQASITAKEQELEERMYEWSELSDQIEEQTEKSAR